MGVVLYEMIYGYTPYRVLAEKNFFVTLEKLLNKIEDNKSDQIFKDKDVKISS